EDAPRRDERDPDADERRRPRAPSGLPALRDRLELARHVCGAGAALLGALREEPRDERVELREAAGRALADAPRLRLQDLRQHRGALAGEGRVAGEREVEHGAERVEVGALVDRARVLEL